MPPSRTNDKHKLALPPLPLLSPLLLPHEPNECRPLDPRRRRGDRPAREAWVARSADAWEGVGDRETAFVLVEGNWGAGGGERSVRQLRVAETEGARGVGAPGEEVAWEGLEEMHEGWGRGRTGGGESERVVVAENDSAKDEVRLVEFSDRCRRRT